MVFIFCQFSTILRAEVQFYQGLRELSETSLNLLQDGNAQPPHRRAEGRSYKEQSSMQSQLHEC